MIFKSTNIPCSILIKEAKKTEHTIIIKYSFTWACNFPDLLDRFETVSLFSLESSEQFFVKSSLRAG